MIGGMLFMVIYFINFGGILYIYPDYVTLDWNFDNQSNTLVAGIPIEELLFAFTFGMY